MIVKNESHVIEKTLSKILQYIDITYWVISDTGSTDNTRELIKNFFNKRNIDGELVEHEWKDFGYNRTKALEVAYNKTDYLFIFDADDDIHGNLVLPELDADMYHFNFGTGFVYKRPLLVNNRLKWKFIGVLHEFLAGGNSPNKEVNIIGDYYIESGKSGDRSKDPNKYSKDAAILEKGYNEEQEESLRNRYAFYCAQSYMDAGNKDKSIEWYKKVTTLSNWGQEKYYSCIMAGRQLMNKGEEIEAIKMFNKANEYDKERMEHIKALTEYFYNNGMHLMVNALYKQSKGYKKNLPNQSDKLFFSTYDLNYHIEYFNSISAYYVSDSDSGYECCYELICNSNIGYHSETAMRNIWYYKDSMLNDSKDKLYNLFINFNKHISKHQYNETYCNVWELLYKEICSEYLCKYNLDNCNFSKNYLKTFKNSNKPIVFLSMTTCKRVDLFQKTVNSIINQWNDVERIDYWFCVDDNSSVEDKKFMKNNYPFFDYYFKNLSEKGHRYSMNIIWNKLNYLKPKYWIHLEDDFVFYDKMNYIEKSIEGLNMLKDKNVKQILFNKGYGETVNDYRVKGYTICDNDNYCLHDYIPNKDFNYPNNHYWPHYSFRPSLIEVKTILELGNYDSSNQFFEMDYANKWQNANYKSAFFNKLTNKHIGRLTSERNDKTIPNAYELNEENQFIKKKPYIKVINLERREDRKDKIISILNENNFKEEEYEIIKAVDGNELKETDEDLLLFVGNDFNNRKGFIGCALSHYKLWQKLVNDNEHSYYIILEDDFIPSKNMKNKINDIMDDMRSKELIFFGYHMLDKYRNNIKHIYNIECDNTKIDKLNTTAYIGGTHGYSINKNGAKLLLKYVDNNGIKHGIDFIIGKVNGEHFYETQPHLCFADWNEYGQEIDSDIQNMYSYEHTIKIVPEIIKNINIENTQTKKNNDNKYPFIKIVNLERRTDRKKTTIENLNKLGFNEDEYEFIKAIDGKLLNETSPDLHYFVGNDFANRRGFIGCALSHYYLWKKLINDDNNNYYFILEDDISVFNDNFKELIYLNKENMLLNEIIFFGYSMFEHIRNTVSDIYNINSTKENIKINKLSDKYVGGTFIYSINKSGAKYMIDYIEKNGIKHGIDYITGKLNKNICYESQPQLAFSDWKENNKDIDTDIQDVYQGHTLDCIDIMYGKMTIAFHDNSLTERGTSVALYDYAYYNETILNNKSIILYDKNSINNDENVINKFKKYFNDRVYSYSKWEEVDEILKREKCKMLYMIKFGIHDDKLSKVCKNVVHCVFDTSDFHGNVYASISETVNNVNGTNYDIVPHMINLPDHDLNMREELGIPNDAIVFGRYGGYEQFDIPYVHNVIKEISLKKKNMYFLFSNTKPFTNKNDKSLSNIIYLDKIYDLNEKVKFINTCDAMIWGRSDGETFGLSIGEFCIKGKPIIATKCGFKEHVNKLKNMCIWYNNEYDLRFILNNINKSLLLKKRTNVFDEYTPENVMKIFKKVFIEQETNLTDSKIYDLFEFINKKDQINNDLYYCPNKSINELLIIAINDKNCVGFNTLGFFKNKIDINNLISSPYFKEKDGIYIKRKLIKNITYNNINENINNNNENEKIYNEQNIKFEIKDIDNINNSKKQLKVKMLCDWQSSKELCDEWSIMINGYTWDNITITDTNNKEEIDYYVIINRPQFNNYYEPSKTLIFHMEPWVHDETKHWGVKTWGVWSNPDVSKFMYVGTHERYLNNIQWKIKIPEQNKIPRLRYNKLIAILSDKYHDDGHKKRIDFVNYVENETEEEIIHIYGNHPHKFNNYIGKLIDNKKENNMIDYKYSFSVENNFEKNYATEKIWEAILCECLTFYWGCPNLEEYIDPLSFVRLDLNNFEESLNTIRRAIKEDWWSQRINIIRKEKERIINELGFFPRLKHLIHNHNNIQ
jgi:GR25 family glycosyltransferase involved in LPS biosynthesis